MKFTKVLLHKNQHLIDNEITQLNSPKEYFQNYIDKVSLLNIELKENDLIQLFENPKAFITDKLTKDETLKVGNLTLNKEKLFDLIDKPIGTDELIDSIISDKQNQDINQRCIWLSKHFIINAQEVVLKPETLYQITNRNSLFIESENQQKGYDKVTQLVKLINEINEIAKSKINLSTELSELIAFNSPNPDDKSTYQKCFVARVQTVKRFV